MRSMGRRITRRRWRKRGEREEYGEYGEEKN